MLRVPPHRVIRAALFAVVCVGVAAILHGAAARCQVSWAGIGIGLPGIGAAAWVGLGRERSGTTLTAGLGFMQVGLHYLFENVGGAAPPAPTASPVAAAAQRATSMPGMPGMVMNQPGPSLNALAMLSAHVLAVIVCGWWLGRCERNFFALCIAVAALAAAPLYRLADAFALLGHLGHAYGRVLAHVLAAPLGTSKHRRTPLLTALSFRGPPVFA
jgi:hypothetical protein